MPELLKRGSDRSNAHAMAWWASAESQLQESTLSRNLSFEMATPLKPFQHEKELDFQVHDLDSSSTHSTGQSYPEVVSVFELKNGGKSIKFKESGPPVIEGKSDEDYTKSTLSSHDYTSPPAHVGYRQSLGGAPVSCPTSFWPGIVASYGPHAMVQPHMICMTPTRVPLPLGLPHEQPVYVNAKQYRAILRRRQYRAKLEAHNKLLKDRKPYLHESRHRHALNRARGPGGRFLNLKKLKQSNNTPAGGQDNSATVRSQSAKNMWGAEIHQLEAFKKSERTCASNIDNLLYQQEFGFSYVPNGNVGPMDHGGGGMHGGMQRYLSVSR